MPLEKYVYTSKEKVYIHATEVLAAYLSTLPFSPVNSVILIICPTLFPITYFPLNLLCFPSGPAGGSTVVVAPQVRMKIREIRDLSGIWVVNSLSFIKTESKHSRYVSGGLFLEWQLNESEQRYQLVVEFSQHVRTCLTTWESPLVCYMCEITTIVWTLSGVGTQSHLKVSFRPWLPLTQIDSFFQHTGLKASSWTGRSLSPTEWEDVVILAINRSPETFF